MDLKKSSVAWWIAMLICVEWVDFSWRAVVAVMKRWFAKVKRLGLALYQSWCTAVVVMT
jgi:hypothetical protein